MEPNSDPTDTKKDEEKLPIWGKLEDERKPSDVIGVLRRYKPFFSRPFADVELTEFDNIDCDGAPIIECFPGIGFVSVMAGKQIIKHLKLPLIGILTSEHFQVSCVLQSEQPSHPARLYGNKKVVVFICEMSMKVPPDSIRAVVDCIFDFAHRHRSPMIYTIEGTPKIETFEVGGEEIQLRMPEEGEEEGEDGVADEQLIVIDDTLLTKLTLRDKSEKDGANPDKLIVSSTKAKRKRKGKKKEEEEKDIEDMADDMFGKLVHYITTDIELAKKLRAMGHIPVVDGIIPGVTGDLLAKSVLCDQEVTVLLNPTSTLLPDPQSAVPILKLIHELMQPEIDLSKSYEELETEGSNLQKLVRGLLAQGLAEKKSNVPFGIYG